MRKFAKVDPVVLLNASSDIWQKVQAAAVYQSYSGGLSHSIDPQGTCYSQDAADGSAGILAAGNAGDHFTQWADDSGVPSLGHRLQLLQPSLGKLAYGYAVNTNSRYLNYSVIATNNGYSMSSSVAASSYAKPAIHAWPAAGYFPSFLEPVAPWSFGAKGVGNLSDATVTVTPKGGSPETLTPSTTPQSIDGMGIISFNPTVTLPARGEVKTYTVKVVAGGKSWEYPVKLYNDVHPQVPTFQTNLPANVTIISGQSKDVAVKVGGYPEFTYQVEKQAKDSSNWSAVGSASQELASHSFNVTVATPTFADGDKVRVVATQDGNKYYSNVMTVKVVPVLTVSASADPTKVVAGSPVTLTATVPTGIDNVSLQWQSQKSGGNWSDISGATNAAYTPTMQAGDDGIKYRVKASATDPAQGPVFSQEITVNVEPKLTVTTQPSDVTTFEGQSVTFTVAVDPSEASVKWQKKAQGDNDWSDIASATGTSYTVSNVGLNDTPTKYRAVATYNKYLTSKQQVVSNEVAYTVVEGLAAGTANPADVEVNEGASVSLNAEFNMTDNVTYQWQRKAPGASDWEDVSGATGNAYTFTPAVAQSGTKYRVKASVTLGTQTSNATSREAVVTVNPLAKVTQNPANQTVIAGEQATFTVQTNGVGTIQWQSKKADAQWADIAGATSATYTVTAADADNGTQYQAVVKAPKEQVVTSTAATLTVVKKLQSASIAADKTELAVGESAQITVTSDPAVNPSDAQAPQVKWQQQKPGSDTWEDLPGNQAVLEYLAKDVLADGSKIRAVVTAPANQSLTTDPVTVSVAGPPVVTSVSNPPKSGAGTEDDAYLYVVQAGTDVTLGVNAAANPQVTEFVWEQFKDGQWQTLPIVGGKAHAMALTTTSSPILLIPAGKVVDGAKYRVTATNSKGSTTTYFTLKLKKVKPGSAGGKNAGNSPALATTGANSLIAANLAAALLIGGAVMVSRRRRTN